VCVAQGELSDLLRGFIFCWDVLGKLRINAFGERLWKDGCRGDSLWVRVWEGGFYVLVCLYVMGKKSEVAFFILAN